ncbi:hypothetical protein Tco_1216067 [Tanacetum coccineum]
MALMAFSDSEVYNDKTCSKTCLKNYESLNGTSVTKMSVPVTTEEKTNKKNELQKIVSRLAILGVVIAQEDLNSKILSSLPPEWNTYVVVWMNKPEVDTISIDDLYNKFKIVKQKVKKYVGASSVAQNLAFMTAPSTGSTNDANTASPYGSDNDVYAFMVENPNGSNLLHQDLEQIHEDDLEAMDLKWQLSLECRAQEARKVSSENQDKHLEKQGTKKTHPKAMLAIMMVPKKLDMSYSGLDEFKEPEFKGYGTENSKQESNIVCDKKSDDSKKSSDDSLVKEQVSKDTSSFVESSLNVDKETVFPVDKKVESVKPKNHEKPVKKSVRYAEMYRSQTPRGNQRNWNG